MAGYAVRIKTGVERDIATLPRDVIMRILQKIEDLSGTPTPFGVRRPSGAEHLYRVRDYRIVYAVHHAEQEIVILYIRHRRNAYRGL